MNEQLNDDELQFVTGGTYTGPVFPYIVRRGDVLSILAQKYGTTVKILVELNGIANPEVLYEGHRLWIPYKL